MLSKPNILVVDDNQFNLIAMRRLLGRLHCTIIAASSGNEALAHCLSHDFALILLDVNMPQMDGYEVARLLKEEPSTQHIPIIFVTACFEDQVHQLLGYQAGAVDYIQKPIDDVILLAKATIFIDLYNNRLLARHELERSETLRKTTTENEARFRQALTDAPIPIMLCTQDGRIVLLNNLWVNLTGYRDATISHVNDWFKQALDGEQLPQMQAFLEQQFSQNNGCRLGELTVLSTSGETMIWDFRSSLLDSLIDKRRIAIIMAIDVTERKRAEEEMRLASLVFQNSNEGMTITDSEGTIISINPAFTALTGYLPEEAIGRNPKILKSGRHDQAFYQAMWHQLNSTGHWKGEIWNRKKSGEIYAEWLSINTIFNKEGAPHRRVAMFSDITQKKASEEIIWQQANFDPLTGLPNRRMFHDRLEQELKKANRFNTPLGLLFLDLDGFKAVNDQLGHGSGDDLLRETAFRLLDCVRETDTVARLGGDEFTVILTDLDEHHSTERAAVAILQKLNAPFLLGTKTAHISASIGITLYPADANSIEELIKNADQAMYAAKEQGRNRFQYFTASMQETLRAKLAITHDLRIALSENQFQLHYQPIVELATGVIHKAEALLRWQHPSQGLIFPSDFIAIAEETGLIIEIGDWVFRSAMSQAAQWCQQYHPDFQISINKSPLQFSNRQTSYQTWLDYLAQLHLPGNHLVVEITESLLLDPTDATNEKLLHFRDAGIQVAIDDFGTGYSCLAYLQKLHIDYLKIDQAFVRDLEFDSKNLALCSAIIMMAHALGLKVIAEGIETQAQHNLLLTAQCDYGQGFFYGKAVPPNVFEQHFCKTSEQI